MAKISLKNPNTGDTAIGYRGVCWLYLTPLGLVLPLIRMDGGKWHRALLITSLHLFSIAITLGIALIFLFFGYNRAYTKRLREKGFLDEDSQEASSGVKEEFTDQEKSEQKVAEPTVRFDAEGCKEKLNSWKYFGIYAERVDRELKFHPYCDSKLCDFTQSSAVDEAEKTHPDSRIVRDYRIVGVTIPQSLLDAIQGDRKNRKVMKSLREKKDFVQFLGSPLNKDNEVHGKSFYVGDDFPNTLSDEEFSEFENIQQKLDDFREWNANEEYRVGFIEMVLSVDGVTLPRALDLWEKFGCLEKLTTASVDEISEVHGIGAGIAGQIKNINGASREMIVAEWVNTDENLDEGIGRVWMHYPANYRINSPLNPKLNLPVF